MFEVFLIKSTVGDKLFHQWVDVFEQLLLATGAPAGPRKMSKALKMGESWLQKYHEALNAPDANVADLQDKLTEAVAQTQQAVDFLRSQVHELPAEKPTKTRRTARG